MFFCRHFVFVPFVLFVCNFAGCDKNKWLTRDRIPFHFGSFRIKVGKTHVVGKHAK
jgi:hypothetical protein